MRLELTNMHAFIAFIDDSLLFLSHSKSWRNLQETQKSKSNFNTNSESYICIYIDWSLYHPNSRFLIIQCGVCHRIQPGFAMGMFWQDSSISWDSFPFLITGFISSTFSWWQTTITIDDNGNNNNDSLRPCGSASKAFGERPIISLGGIQSMI